MRDYLRVILITWFWVCLFLVSYLHVGQAQAVSLCRAISSDRPQQALQSSNTSGKQPWFRESQLSPQSKVANAQEVFRKWAVEESDFAFAAFNSGLPAEIVFEMIADSRNKLAGILGNNPKASFGKPRPVQQNKNFPPLAEARKRRFKRDFNKWIQGKRIVYDSPVGLYIATETNPTKQDLLRLFDEIFKDVANDESDLLMAGGEIPGSEKFITLADGENVFGGTLQLEDFMSGYLFVRHPSPLNAKRIFNDVKFRINSLISEKNQDFEANQKEFLTTLYNYYNGMPYGRGSASIGLVLFAGLYKSLFNRPMPAMPDGVDYIAMLSRTSDEFSTRVLRFWKTQE